VNVKTSPATAINKEQSCIYKGLEVIHCPPDNEPFENILSYARLNLSAPLISRVEEYVHNIRESMRHNRPLHLNCNDILQKITDPEHRKILGALVQDIPVILLKQRYDILRKMYQSDENDIDFDQLLEKYWLRRQWQVDPELPNFVARLIIGKMSQWDLMCLLHDKIMELSACFTRNGKKSKHLKRLGRLVSFLRWAPYNWTEEILLKMPELCPLEKGSKIHLQVWISVMRAFYCRVHIQKKTITELFTLLIEHFNGKIPMDLRQYVKAVLISGGLEGWYYLEKQILESNEIFFNEFYLLTMAIIDRAATAQFIRDYNAAIRARITSKEYMHLLATIGECTDETVENIEQFWNDSNESTKFTILDMIIEFNWKEFWPFLVAQAAKPSTLQLKIRIYDAIVHLGTFDDVIQLLPTLDSQHPVVYYHLIEQCHHLLLEHPIMLTRLKDISVLSVFETARQHLYSLYRLLFNYHDLIKDMLKALEYITEEGIDTFSLVVQKQEPTITDETNNGDVPAISSDDSVAGLLELVQRNHQWHSEKYNKIQQLGDILEYLIHSKPQNKNSIFGFGQKWQTGIQLLTKSEFCIRYDTYTTEDFSCTLKDYQGKILKSINLFQEYFLFKEWFIRRAPFVLHESIPDIIQKIHRGDEIYFNPYETTDPIFQEYLKKAFTIFYECTKHGVYLTDYLLNYLLKAPQKEIPVRILLEFTRRRSLISRGVIEYDPQDIFDRHLQFTTFAHIYRYGKESMTRPPIIYLWLRYIEAATWLNNTHCETSYPQLPPHPEMQTVVGPFVQKMYEEHIDDANRFLELVNNIFQRFKGSPIRIRVIPNITYGLFCLTPVMSQIHRKGIHISLAGMSSRYCDDLNIHEFSVRQNSIYPVKPYLFSTASNYGTLNHDRILIVVDGTMEPIDRHDPHKMRLPKAHRGYINHLVAVNYIRSKYGYGMDHPEREIAAAMHLSVRYVQNLIGTPNFKHLINNLLLSFDRDELKNFHQRARTGHTYYTFMHWNPDGLSAWIGSRGDRLREIPCLKLRNLRAPALLFVSMNGIKGRNKVPAYFDNNPEVEKSRIILGPSGAWLDTGWPHSGEGIVVEFPEGENQ